VDYILASDEEGSRRAGGQEGRRVGG